LIALWKRHSAWAFGAKTSLKSKRPIESPDLDESPAAHCGGELEATRERQDNLRQQIDRLRSLMEASRSQSASTRNHFRAAISSAAWLVGGSTSGQNAGGDAESGPKKFVFPALDQRHGADPSWAATLDTLRAPRKT